MTAWLVVVAPPKLHTESTIRALPDLVTFRFSQDCCGEPPKFEFISLSVAASMHCRMVWTGMASLSKLILRSHWPALRAGVSRESAGEVHNKQPARTTRERRIVASPSRGTLRRDDSTAQRLRQQIDVVWKRSLNGDQSPSPRAQLGSMNGCPSTYSTTSTLSMCERFSTAKAHKVGNPEAHGAAILGAS
jgi:hypothetical protein